MCISLLFLDPKHSLFGVNENNLGLMLSSLPSLLMLASFVQLVNTKII